MNDDRDYATEFRLLVENVVDYAIFLLDPEGIVTTWNVGARRMKGYERDEIVGRHLSVFYPTDAVEDGVPARNLRVAAEEGSVEDAGWRVRRDGSRFWARVTITALYEGDELVGYAKITRDMTERRRRERELERQRDELAVLERTNAVIRSIDQRLVTATTQDEVESAVCTLLVEDGGYGYAWIGTHDPATDHVEPSAWAGRDEDLLDVDNGGPSGASRPAAVLEALRAGEARVVQNLVEIEDGSWPASAIESGYRTAAAVPIRYGERSFGVLVVLESRPYAFEDREVDVLGELGETAGHAINALKTRQLLLAEAAIELEFRVTDEAALLVRAAGALDATLHVAGVTPATDGAYLYYLQVDGDDPDAVRSFAGRTPSIRGARAIRTADGDQLWELVVEDGSPLFELVEYGGALGTVTAVDGEAHITAQFPPDVATRTVVDAVRSSFPGTELVAQREVDRTAASARGLHADIAEALTDRQSAVLNAAYHSGYLEQPRGSTGEELAASLGITASTFHQHFRAAERKLVEAYLGDDARRPRDPGPK